MFSDQAAQALHLVKSGNTATAVALIEALPPLARADETIARVYALALAQSGETVRALAAIRAFLERSEANIQTRVLGARLLEDNALHQDAFLQYEKIVTTQPQQSAFWRGLWRAALASGDRATTFHALALTRGTNPPPMLEASVVAAALNGLRQHCSNRAERDAALSFAQANVAIAAIAAMAAIDASVRWAATRLVVALAPTEADRWVRNHLPQPTLDATSSADTLSAALAMPQLFADEAAIDAWRSRYGAALQQLHDLAMADVSLPQSLLRHTAFSLAYHGRNDVALQTLRGDCLAQCVRTIAPPLARQKESRNDARIRVGFVSKHLRDCTVGHYFRRFMTDLDSAQIAVYTYACGSTDAMTDAIERHVTVSRRFALSTDDDHRDDVLCRIATEIANDALDVLIYPEIGMEPLIEKLAAMRLAPLQCALWGHPDTTGLPTIDVFFSAEHMEPANAVEHYREQLVRLPGLGCAYPRPPAPASLSRSQLGLPMDAPLLVCAQSSFKWRPQFVDAIAKILQRNVRAKLVYFRSRDSVAAFAFDEYLHERLAMHNIDASERTKPLAETTREQFLAVLAASDLSLDSFDFSGGNTTLDALSVGLPVVTLPGEFMRGRQSMAMLQMIGAPQLIAHDADDYGKIASGLIADCSALAQMRATITANADRLFDDTSAVEALSQWILSPEVAKVKREDVHN
jgi:predicted O-linked N-acetylglucosamine transferase (SPINDLY family)